MIRDLRPRRTVSETEWLAIIAAFWAAFFALSALC